MDLICIWSIFHGKHRFWGLYYKQKQIKHHSTPVQYMEWIWILSLFDVFFISNQYEMDLIWMELRTTVFKSVWSKLLTSFEAVWRVFQGSFWVFHGSFKSVSRLFQECFKEVSRVFQGSFKVVSRRFQGCFTEVSRGFQGSFEGV